MTSDALSRITPVILTFNEEANVERALASLQWATQVVVLDSGSTDSTARIVAAYPNTVLHTKAFRDFRSQWEYAIHQVDIQTEYMLGLDADMEVTPGLRDELSTQFFKERYDGGLIPFDYRYYGHSLAGSLCPPQLRLFRRDAVEVVQLNHGHKFIVKGSVYRFRHRLIHDDRKPLERWVNSQLQYQVENERELTNGGRRRARDLLRRTGLMPPLMGLLAYARAGGPFRGAAAARYAYERMVAEGVLAIRLLDHKLRDRD